MLDKYLNVNKENKAHKYVSRVLICIIILLLSLIGTTISDSVKAFYKEHIFNESFDFMKFKNFFSKVATSEKEEKNQDDNPKDAMVMKSFIEYDKKEKYSNGEKYTGVKDNFINALESGIVIFAGERENYGKTIIIQGSNGFDIWYSFLEDIDVTIYDYIKAKSIIGGINGEFGLTITKDGKYYTYEEYLDAI